MTTTDTISLAEIKPGHTVKSHGHWVTITTVERIDNRTRFYGNYGKTARATWFESLDRNLDRRLPVR